MKIDYKWFAVSIIPYISIRIIEYSTGQMAQPEWIIDFFPIILPPIFILLDGYLNLFEGKR